MDAFRPTLRTRAPSSLTFTTATLQADSWIRDLPFPFLKPASLFLWILSPYLNQITPSSFRQPISIKMAALAALVQGLTGEGKYFYRAYSKNAEGVGYGSVYDFTTLETAQGPSWAQASCRCSQMVDQSMVRCILSG